MGVTMRGFVAGFVACVVLVVVGAVGYSYSGLADIAAARPDNPVVAWLLRNAYVHARDHEAANVAVPANLDTPEAVKAGAKLYNDECIYCHGAPGEDATVAFLSKPPPAGPDVLDHEIRRADDRDASLGQIL
jgi:mono/diheme cytochrome c family protein